MIPPMALVTTCQRGVVDRTNVMREVMGERERWVEWCSAAAGLASGRLWPRGQWGCPIQSTANSERFVVPFADGWCSGMAIFPGAPGQGSASWCYFEVMSFSTASGEGWKKPQRRKRANMPERRPS